MRDSYTRLDGAQLAIEPDSGGRFQISYHKNGGHLTAWTRLSRRQARRLLAEVERKDFSDGAEHLRRFN